MEIKRSRESEIISAGMDGFCAPAARWREVFTVAPTQQPPPRDLSVFCNVWVNDFERERSFARLCFGFGRAMMVCFVTRYDINNAVSYLRSLK